MAKTSFQIWMDYKNATNSANRLDEIANKIENASQRDLMGNLNQLASNWKSDSSNQYRKKGQNISNNLTSIAKNIRKTASTIRTMAKNTYDAEMQALQIARARSYK